MEVYGIGTDIISIERMAGLVNRKGERALARLFTDAEREYCERYVKSVERYAGRFAAKEAVSKALGTGIAGGVSFKGVEIVHDEFGKPMVVLHGSTKQAAEAKGIRLIHVSISHERTYAVAYATALC